MIVKVAKLATAGYLRVATRIAGKMLALAQAVPKRRDRLSHKRYGRSFLLSLRFTGGSRPNTSLLIAKKIKLPRPSLTQPPYIRRVPIDHKPWTRAEASKELLGEDCAEELLSLLPLLRRDSLRMPLYHVPGDVGVIFSDVVVDFVKGDRTCIQVLRYRCFGAEERAR